MCVYLSVKYKRETVQHKTVSYILMAIFTGCNKDEVTGMVEIKNNSSMKADGGIAEYDNTSKMNLIPHYIKELGARHFGGQRMVILKDAAMNLITRYYPDFFDK